MATNESRRGQADTIYTEHEYIYIFYMIKSYFPQDIIFFQVVKMSLIIFDKVNSYIMAN